MKHLIFPNRLKRGDTIRVIAPARSLSIISEDNQKRAINLIEKNFGLNVSFGAFVNEIDFFDTLSILSRINDLHEAFADPSIKGILTVIGGFSSNQLLDHIDYELIKANPKILCGFSDITVLCNAITEKTGLVTYSGPHFSSFAMSLGNEYICKWFQAVLMSESSSVPLTIEPSSQWSDDMWFTDQEDRHFIKNPGPVCLHPGRAQGHLIGGNISCLRLLQGTKYFPTFSNYKKDGIILFLEDDDLVGDQMNVIFDQQIESIIQATPQFFQIVRGLIIGRCQLKSNMTLEKFKYIFSRKKEFLSVPIMVDVDFGHTSPICILPIGGLATIDCSSNHCTLKLLSY